MIPYGRQDISKEDIDSVVAVLKSDFLTQGPAVESFERDIAEYVGARYAVSVSNATAALHIGALALELGPGDLLWTSPNTFVASSNCAFYCGATPDFVDIDPKTYNMDLDALEQKLKSGSKRPKVVVPVHFAGLSVDMKRLSSLSAQYGFRIMEDASHAIGGSFGGSKIGSCEFSDLTVFSLHPVKIITTGEGGVLTTNSETLYRKLLRLRSHGITRVPAEMKHSPDGPWYYEQIDLGLNYRLTDIQAALGSSQLRRVDTYVTRRQEIAKMYQNDLKGLPLTWQKQSEGSLSAYHLFVVCLSDPKHNRKQVFEKMRALGIGVNVHYIPVYRQPYYARLNISPESFPQAEGYYRTAISLPMFSALSDSDYGTVVNSLKKVLV